MLVDGVTNELLFGLLICTSLKLGRHEHRFELHGVVICILRAHMLRDRLRLLGLGHRTTANVIAARSITAEACTRHRHSLHVHSWWSLHRSHHLLLLSHHLSAHDGSIRHPLHHWLTSVAHSWVHLSLLMMVVVAILLSLIEPLLATLIGAHLVILMIVVGTTSIIHLGVHRMTPSLLMALDTHLESRFEKHGQ